MTACGSPGMTALEWIEENAARLREQDWFLVRGNDLDGLIRCKVNGGEGCPLSVLAPSGPWKIRGASDLADAHGLPDSAAQDIAEAADGYSYAPADVREALLAATGLTDKAALR